VLILTLASLASTIAQEEIQWADTVLNSKGSDHSKLYGVEQVLGKPNIYPGNGLIGGAWSPSKFNSEANVKVGYKTPIQVRQILIAETFNPGAIKRITLFDKNNQAYVVSEFEAGPITKKNRLLHIVIELTPYEVTSLQIDMDGHSVKGYNAIDAIGISQSETPIDITPKIDSTINPELITTKLDSTVNSNYREIKPLLSPDGKTMYFSRANHPDNVGGVKDHEDIWFSDWNDSLQQWELAQNIGRPLNNEGPNYISSITPDGNSMLFLLGNQYSDEHHMQAGLSLANINKDGTIGGITEIEIEDMVNESNLAYYYMANNRKAILISVDRETPEELGGLDLYVTLEKEGQWSNLIHLGNMVNSAGDDESPFLAADNKTLYFSSNGRSGYGKLDVFVTRRLDDTWQNWTEPENLGPGINSGLDDVFFTLPQNGNYAYYCKEDTNTGLDMYKVYLPDFHKPDPVVVIKGMVTNKETNQPLPNTTIIYERLSDGKEMGRLVADKDGHFEITLPSGDKYGYLAESDGYISVHANLDLTALDQNKEIPQNLHLAEAVKGQVITFNNIFFDFDKSTLKQESFTELNRLAKYLIQNPKINLEISGHTDNSGPATYNLKLSEKRATSVVNYLLEKGASQNQLNSKGYGMSKPKDSNKTRAGRKTNRRVELEVL